MTCGPDVPADNDALLRRGRILEVITLGWNVAGIVVLAIAAIGARSVALAGFGLDSLIEIGASTVGAVGIVRFGKDRQRRALRAPRSWPWPRIWPSSPAVLAGLILNAAAGLWWADPLAALVIVV